ncbi:hypothetical protein ACQP2P_19640 [Dactylosporangium sp. CA-139114]|uniref:hypothetical protein n=1 Tax=Dactylosporangium sp. CA-139114 TaxID=3239931 RepID=UPI003D9575AD
MGSGFGGGVRALRRTGKGHRAGVLETGRRFAGADFAPAPGPARVTGTVGAAATRDPALEPAA